MSVGSTKVKDQQQNRPLRSTMTRITRVTATKNKLYHVFLLAVTAVGVIVLVGFKSEQDNNLGNLLRQPENLVNKETLTYWSSSRRSSTSLNPLLVPEGKAKNLPSIRVESVAAEGNVDKTRYIYGGAGDKSHLGGFTELDLHGVSPSTWTNMIQDFNVRSVLDVGCGRGVSTSWFLDHGTKTLCVEGSHDAFHQSVLDDPYTSMVEHDFSRGPWWPEDTYDAVWSVEFLEVRTYARKSAYR